MKLFVDDIRREWDGWHRAQTVTEAIRILATMPVTEVSLDHDICCEDTNGRQHSSRETFEPVARYLALMPADIRPIITFHTGNPEGGERMANILGLHYWSSIVHYNEPQKETL